VAGRVYLSIIPAGTRDTLTETRTHGFGLVAICGLHCDSTLGAVVDAQRDYDVDLLVSLYEHSTVRMSPNDPQCATINFDTGVAQGSALSPLLFLVFMNALLGLITDRGRKLHVSHGLKCGVQLRKKGTTQDTGQAEQVGQFNLIGFVDDLSLFTQTLGGAQALLEAIQEFELWSGLKVNRKKTCAMVVELQGTGQRQTDETLWLSWHPRWRVGI